MCNKYKICFIKLISFCASGKLPRGAIFKMKRRERQTMNDMKNLKTPED